MTGIQAPALALVQKHGDLFRQLGAAEVTATNLDTVQLTYYNNRNGVNAAALLNPSMDGVKLLVANKAMTRDAHSPTADGMADLLKGVSNLHVQQYTGRNAGGDAPQIISVATSDYTQYKTLRDLLNSSPAPGVEVGTQHISDAVLA